nr:unnamed protein product [Callosobruchus analis]
MRVQEKQIHTFVRISK